MGGGDIWVVSEKKILQADFEGKSSWKGIPSTKTLLHGKKIDISWRIMLEKKTFTLACQEKKFHYQLAKKILTQIKSPIPPPPPPHKSQMLGSFTM